MKTVYFFTAILLAFAIPSCILEFERVEPSGNILEEEISFEAFDELEVGNSFDLYLTQGNNTSVMLETDDNLREYVEINQYGKTIVVKLENGISTSGKATLKLYVTAPMLKKINASGASEIFVEEEWTAENLDIELSGASNFEGVLAISNTLEIEMSGASVSDVEGNARDFELSMSGASGFRGYDFNTAYLDASLSGASSANITVDEEMEIEASGASSLKYKGAAVIKNQNISGASSVRKVD